MKQEVRKKDNKSDSDLQQAEGCGARSGNPSHWPRRKCCAGFGTSRRVPWGLMSIENGVMSSWRRLDEGRRYRVRGIDRMSVCTWALRAQSSPMY